MILWITLTNLKNFFLTRMKIKKKPMLLMIKKINKYFSGMLNKWIKSKKKKKNNCAGLLKKITLFHPTPEIFKKYPFPITLILKISKILSTQVQTKKIQNLIKKLIQSKKKTTYLKWLISLKKAYIIIIKKTKYNLKKIHFILQNLAKRN